MIGTNFMEEIDCGSFFDHIDDLLEFPNDDVEIGKSGSGSGGIIGCDAFPPLWPEDALDPDHLSGPGSDAAFSNGNSASDLSTELAVPVSPQLWPTNIINFSNYDYYDFLLILILILINSY